MNCTLPVIILGAGGHGKVVINALLASKREIIGIVDSHHQVGDQVLGVKVIGDDTKVFEFSPSAVELVNGIGALPDSDVRWRLTATFREKGYTFATVVHPQTIIAPDVILEEGVQLMAGSIIQPGSLIGQDTIVNTRVSIDHDCTIGNGCHIAPGTVVNGSVTIDQRSFIGTGSCIIQNITIGERVIVGAGSIICANIPSFVKIIQKRSS